MKFYVGGAEYAEIPGLFWYRNGAFLDRLVGINTINGKEDFRFQPIYQAALRFQKNGELLFVDVGWNSPKFTVVVMPRRPFIVFLKTSKMVIEEME